MRNNLSNDMEKVIRKLDREFSKRIKEEVVVIAEKHDLKSIAKRRVYVSLLKYFGFTI